MPVAGIGMAPGTLAIRLGVVTVLLGLKWYYDRRGIPPISTLLHVTAFSIFFAGAAETLSYLSASLWINLYDAAFIRAAQFLGLDWLAYARLAASVPHLVQVCALVYLTSLPQIILMLICLCRLNRMDRAEGLAFDLAFAGFACILISTLVPALGTYVSLDPAHIDLAVHVEHVEAMRAGTLKTIDLGNAQGLITFPSYHVAISLALIWASRGGRLLFAFTLLLNVAIILATPIIGGHYFVDLFGGAVVWAGTLALRNWIRKYRSRGAAPQAKPLRS